MGMLCSWVYHIIFDGNILDWLTWENVGWVHYGDDLPTDPISMG